MMRKQAIIVGIDNYQTFSLLKQASHDAEEMANALSLREYAFNISLLKNEDASFEFLDAQISLLLAGDSDIKLLYFAGHGITINNNVFICAYDCDISNPGIDLFALKDKIIKAKGTVIIILDCCHAGAADVREQTRYRSITEGDLDRALGDLTEGKILLAACGESEVAQESEQLSHGIFTSYLLEGLLGTAANRQGIVTPMALFDYVAERMKTEYKKNPVWKGEQKGQIVLGAGFSQTVYESGQKPLIPTKLQKEIELEARSYLDNYFNKTKVPFEEWRSHGYRQACQLLEPILRWFERQIMEYPGITSSRAFDVAYREVRTRLAELGAIGIDYVVDEGQLIEYLGAGAFGSVYKVDRQGENPLAYKVYHSSELNVREKVSRFYRGYRAMNQLNHPFIVKVHKYTQCPVGFYMDFIDGPNLRNWIGTVREPEYLTPILIKIAETLKHAHGRNVIHRDIKPENIIMKYNTNTTNWDAYLTDFDLAWFSTATQVTKDAFGVIFYAAPEQLSKPQSRIAHAPTTDVYSFGQLCYFVTTGSNPTPFRGADNLRGLRERINDWKTVTAASTFLQLYSDCTQEDPGKRPNDFRVIIDILHNTQRLLLQIPSTQVLAESNFLNEISYQSVGLPEKEIPPAVKSFFSLSRRTVVEYSDLSTDISGKYTIRIKFISLEIGLPGVTNRKARQALDTRIDKALTNFPNVNRRSGTEDPFNITLTIHRVEPTLAGVDKCRVIISRTIDSMESA